MKLLVITQKVDKEDDLLGFFHGWLKEFAKHFEQVIVICLYQGSYDLPANVKVLSLGKEKYKSLNSYIAKLLYCWNLYKYIWQERKNYDCVFVHMNREYIVLGGLFWKLWRKKIMFWYNHQFGNVWSKVAGAFADQIFYTSPFSFFSKHSQALQMPVGIDTSVFKPDKNINRKSHTLLFIGRISPIKNVHILIEACRLLNEKGQDFTLTIAGEPGNKETEYYKMIFDTVAKYNLKDRIEFIGKVPNHKTPEIYSRHEIFINLTNSGSLDKTIFEAVACGTVPVVCNRSLQDVFNGIFLFQENDANDLCRKLIFLLQNKNKTIEKFPYDITNFHSLENLVLLFAKQSSEVHKLIK